LKSSGSNDTIMVQERQHTAPAFIEIRIRKGSSYV